MKARLTQLRKVCPQSTETVSTIHLTEGWTSRGISSDGPIANARESACFLRGTPDAERGFRTHNRRHLQNAFNRRSTVELAYFVFDLLYLNGYDLRVVRYARAGRYFRNCWARFRTTACVSAKTSQRTRTAVASGLHRWPAGKCRAVDAVDKALVRSGSRRSNAQARALAGGRK
jgi:hypothetical protein